MIQIDYIAVWAPNSKVAAFPHVRRSSNPFEERRTNPFDK